MSLLARRYLLLLILMALPATGQAREIVGWVEKVRLYPWDIVAKARIDTGAKTSSMGVDALKYFYRNNEQWVRFTATNFKDVTIEIERKVIRISKIKDPYGKLIQRPVVNIGICLGGYYENAEVNLADRKRKNYQMLIGRRFLNGHYLVDPNAVHINPPKCEKPENTSKEVQK